MSRLTKPVPHPYYDAHELCDWSQAVGRPEAATFLDDELARREAQPGSLLSFDLGDMEQDVRDHLDEYSAKDYPPDVLSTIAWLRGEFGNTVAIFKGW